MPSGVLDHAPLPQTDYDRAIDSLLGRLHTDADLPNEVRSAVSRAVLYQWNRVQPNAAQLMSEAAGVASRFASELLATRGVSDEIFAAARDAFGERRLVNMIVLIGVSNLHCSKLALAGYGCRLDDR